MKQGTFFFYSRRQPGLCKAMENGKIFLCYADTTPLPAFSVPEVITPQQGA